MLPSKDRVAKWMQKQDPYICCLQETHFISQDTHTQRETESVGTGIHANGNKKKAGVAILRQNRL